MAKRKKGIKRISVTNKKARSLLEKVADFDASQGDPGDEPDFTESMIISLKFRVENDIASTPAGRKWLKAYDEAQAQKADGNA